MPAKKARPLKAGSHNLHYHINDLNTCNKILKKCIGVAELPHPPVQGNFM